MTAPRFPLPRRRTGRHGETRRRSGATGTPRTAVGGAMAGLALTAAVATAVVPGTAGAETATTATPTGAASTAPSPGPSASVVTSSDSATVTATAALQRAETVTQQTASLPRKQERRIEARAERLAELLESRGQTGASRASERAPLPESGGREVPADSATLAEATTKLTKLLDDAESTAIEVQAAPPTPAEVADVQADRAKKAAKKIARHADSLDDFANGRVPAGKMKKLSFAKGETLRADAAAQLERLDVAYHARFGKHLSVTDSYRSYESQVATRASKGYMAAVPGYSNHGWGVAVDLGDGVESFGTPEYEWMREHAPEFGWDNPAWARADGRKPEAWHWEYAPIG
ncbi:M15 family metallopeptidase [Isoptericola sp. AK164]|uniref:M15 family metallopeptidase n=1 Tax=Isoptericola sp. AK164 TaxID=3024246 RepID=UPI002418A48D|nr:M15 family metallopeptidase [Isoptericola sp. AK164]